MDYKKLALIMIALFTWFVAGPYHWHNENKAWCSKVSKNPAYACNYGRPLEYAGIDAVSKPPNLGTWNVVKLLHKVAPFAIDDYAYLKTFENKYTKVQFNLDEARGKGTIIYAGDRVIDRADRVKNAMAGEEM